jgi:hypothetical protein
MIHLTRKAIALVILASMAALCCAQGNPVSIRETIPLTVEVQQNSLVLQSSKKLGDSTWPDGVGEAQVRIEPKDGSSFSNRVKYEIKNAVLIASIRDLKPVFLKPGTKVMLTGIKDAKGPNKVTLFQGVVPGPIEASPEDATSAGGTAKRASDKGDKAKDKGKQKKDSSADDESPKEQPDPAPTAMVVLLPTPTPARGVTPKRTPTPTPAEEDSSIFAIRGGGFWILCFGIAALVIGGVLYVIRHRRRRKLINPSDRDAVNAASVSPPETAREIQGNKLEPAIQQAAENLGQRSQVNAEPAQTGRDTIKQPLTTAQEISGIKEEIKKLKSREVGQEEIERMVEEALVARLGSLADLQLTRSRPEPARRAETVVNQERALLTAVVNRYLASNTQSTQELMSLAENAGLTVKLAGHGDLDRVFQDGTTFEYPFNFTGERPWIFTRIGQTDDYWAAPFDHSFFRMGVAPVLLNRLFEGTNDLSGGVRFSRLYRPCRLRRIMGKTDSYLAVEKGLLQLQGASPPNEPLPKEYELFNSVKQVFKGSGRPSVLGTILKDWQNEISGQIEACSREIRAFKGEMENLTARAPQQGDQENELRQVRNQLKKQISDLEFRLTERLESLQAAMVTTQSFQNPFPAEIREPAIASAKPPVLPAPALEAPVLQKQEPPPFTEPPRAAILSAAVPHDGRLPAKWQEAWKEAAEFSEVEPGNREVPKPGIYVLRLKALSKALSALSPQTPVSVAHLKYDGGKDKFEIHVIDSNLDGAEISCSVCGGRQNWQLAVCIGHAGQGDVSILYPWGQFGKGNYAPAYSALIEDLSGAAFFIAEIKRPAELQLIDARSATYAVKRKLLWSPPAQSMAGSF